MASRHLSPARVFVLAIAPLAAGIFLYTVKDLTAVAGGDLPSYLNLDASRPVAYGMFLHTALQLGFSLNAIPLFQLGFLLISLWLTACVWTASMGQVAIALAWQWLSIANLLLAQSSVYLIPDTVSAALIMLALASWIAITTQYSRPRLFTLLMVCGFAGLFRPTNLILLIASAGLLSVLPGLMRRERWIALGAAAAVSGLTLAASPLFYLYHHGSMATTSPAARGLLQKTLFTKWSPDQTATRCGGAVIAAATNDVVGYLETAPPPVRSVLEDKYSNYLRFSVIVPGLQNQFHLASEGEINSLIGCYVFARFKQNPSHFVTRFVHDYLRLGLYLVFIDARERAIYATFVADNVPPQPAASVRLDDQIASGFSRAGFDAPPEIRADNAGTLFDPPLARATVPLLLLRIFQGSALAMSAVVLVQFFLQVLWLKPKTGNPIMVWSALVLQANTIATAVFEMPLPRYMTALWPLSVAVVLLAAWLAVPAARAVFGHSRPLAAQSESALRPR